MSTRPDHALQRSPGWHHACVHMGAGAPCFANGGRIADDKSLQVSTLSWIELRRRIAELSTLGAWISASLRLWAHPARVAPDTSGSLVSPKTLIEAGDLFLQAQWTTDQAGASTDPRGARALRELGGDPRRDHGRRGRGHPGASRGSDSDPRTHRHRRTPGRHPGEHLRQGRHRPGGVKGAITATDEIELSASSASVEGDLIAPSIRIVEGAYFRGYVDMQIAEAHSRKVDHVEPPAERAAS